MEATSKTQVSQTRDFEYKEKNVIEQVNKIFRRKLKGLELFKSNKEHISVTLASVYGEAFETSAKGTRYKSSAHSAFIFNFSLEVEWYGRQWFGETTLGSAAGKVIISDVSYDNTEPENWQTKVKLDSEGTTGMAPQGPPPDPSPVQTKIRQLLKDHGVSILLSAVREVVDTFNKEGFVGAERKLEEEEARKSTSEEKEPVAQSESTAKYMEELRNQMLGEAFKKLVVEEDSSNFTGDGKGQWKFDFCSMEDQDVEKLLEKLSMYTEEVKHLSMDYNKISDRSMQLIGKTLEKATNLRTLSLRNNSITAAGVQTIMASLCLGSMPNLEVLDLRDNKELEMGSTLTAILNGLKAFRSTLEVRVA